MDRRTFMQTVGALSLTAPASALAGRTATAVVGFDPAEQSIAALGKALAAKTVTAEQLTAAYLDRIARYDRSGPAFRSVLSLNPDALAIARALDVERRAGKVRGPLHGVPILLKDNIETADRIATTAGSVALAGSFRKTDAPVAARLRAAGAVVLGKANLSEWANFRSTRSNSGWSSRS